MSTPPGIITREAPLEVVRDATAADAPPTIRVAISSELPFPRRDWTTGKEYLEVLSHTPGDIDLSAASRGLPVLVSHDRTELPVGIVTDVGVGADGVLRGNMRLGRSERAREIERDVLDGILLQVSVGAEARTYESEIAKGVETRRFRQWMPREVSLVAVAADPTVGIGRTYDPNVRHPAEEQAPMSSTDKQDGAPAAAPEIKIVRDTAREDQVQRISALAREHKMTERLPEWIEKASSESDVLRDISTELKTRMSRPIPSATEPSVDGMTRKEAQEYSFLRAAMFEAGMLDANQARLEREVSDALIKVRRGLNQPETKGVLVPTRLERAGIDTGTSGAGSNLVFTRPGDFIDQLRNQSSVMRAGARMLRGLTGPVSFPKQLTPATAAWRAENPGSDASESNAGFGAVTLAFNSITATTSFSRELRFSSPSSLVDIEAIVRQDLAAVIALAVDLAALNGAGTNAPLGILQDTNVTQVTLGTNGAVMTYAKALELRFGPAKSNANIGPAAFIVSPKVAQHLSTIYPQGATVAGFPIWGNNHEPGVPMDGSVLGIPAYVSNQVPDNLTKGTNTTINSAIVYGHFSEILVGEFGSMELITDPYNLKKQGMIELTANAAFDVALRHARAFSVVKDVLTGL